MCHVYESCEHVKDAFEVTAIEINNEDELESAIKRDAASLVLHIAKHGNCETVCEYCCGYGSLECLKIAHRFDCPWNWRTCANAAEYGHLECLNYAHENGCKWDSMAAFNGHLRCLEYAHENGCEWDEKTYVLAAKNGHLKCLRYAHKNNCPWDEEIYSVVAHNGHLEYVRSVRENCLVWENVTSFKVHDNCLKYICLYFYTNKHIKLM